MQVHHLPNDIFPDRADQPQKLIFHNYVARMGSFKGKSVLHTNAISIVISGEKTMHFADKSVHIKDDEFHFLSAGNCLASIDLSRQEFFRSILIFFDNSVLSDFFIKYALLADNIKFNGTHSPYLSFKKDPFLLNYIGSLNLLFESSDTIPEQMRLLKFEELMLHLLLKYPSEILSFQSDRSQDFDDFRIRKTVETNINSSITMDELAFLCNTSLSTFNRRFMKIYGTSPSKWLLLRRMEMAKNLLLNYREKPSEVYHKVGYENHSSFSQSFRQTFGISPKEFQNQNMTVERQVLED
jgi:AraC-like DNA-binding protein